jgi:hypothetical protein
LDKIYSAVNDVIVQSLLKIGISCGLTWDARKCSDLNSLSDEYGVEIFRNGDEVLYREYLRSFTVKDVEWRSQADRMQELIRTAGFTAVMVVKNNMLDDPRRWTEQRSSCFCGDPASVCGSESAMCGYEGYAVLANWDMKNDAGLDNGFQIDNRPELFGSVVFVCGGVSYNLNGSIGSLESVDVSVENMERLKLAVLRGMPSDCVAVMVTNVVSGSVISETGYDWEDVISMTGLPTDNSISQIGL